MIANMSVHFHFVDCRAGIFHSQRQISVSSKICDSQAGETAQCLRALALLPEDPSSVPSTHIVANNCP